MNNNLNTEGIIFRSLKYSETSVILDIYTLEFGLISCIVSGVRKKNSKKANIYHPMNIIQFIALGNEDKLARIKEADYDIRYDDLTFNVIKSSIAMFVIDLSRNAIKEKESNKELYLFIKGFLQMIDLGKINLAMAPIIFCIQMTQYLGFEINNNYSENQSNFDLKEGSFTDKNAGHNYIMNKDLSFKFSQILRHNIFDLSKTDRNLILDYLLDYFRYHIEGFKPLKSIGVLRTVLS